MPRKSDVEPWLAVLWTVVWPGLGHLHARAFGAGITILAFTVLCFVGGCWCFISASGPVIWAFLGFAAYYLAIPLAAVHVFRSARRSNDPEFEGRRRTQKDPWLATFLSFLFPGLGHFYLRAPLLAIAWILFTVVGMVLATLLLCDKRLPSIGSFVVPCLYALLRFLAISQSFSIVDEPRRLGVGKVLKSVGLPLVIAVLLTVGFDVAYRASYELLAIAGRSMQPTVADGDRVIVRHVSIEEASVGDVIVFRDPTRADYRQTKCLAAIGPCRVRIRRDGRLEVEGAERALPGRLDSTNYRAGPRDVVYDWVTLNVNECFVLGDNPERSADSRYYGPVPLRSVEGIVYKIFWPLDRAGPVNR